VDFHPLANIFPMMPPEEQGVLLADIAQNKLKERIVLLDEKIIDGRNRYVAMSRGHLFISDGESDGESDPEVRKLYFREFGDDPGDGDDPLAFVLSKNLIRRHLDSSQQAMVAARIANLPGAGNPHGEAKGNSANLRNYNSLKSRANVSASAPISQADAAKMVGATSPRSVTAAKKVLKTDNKKLIQMVDNGMLPVSVAEKIAKLTPEEQDMVLSDANPEQAIKKVARQNREHKLADNIRALPTKKYGVILADPPWRFETRSENGMDRSADNHYPTMTLTDIENMDLGKIAAEDCVVFLWATPPMLPDAVLAMESWGFEYKTHFVWVKDKIGLGYWNRNQHEVLLIGTKGNIPAPAPGDQWPSVIIAPRGEHSAKPTEVYELIESYFPNLPRIELFSRSDRPEWTHWGLEAPANAAE
jgi:N6-adenosine-specific RNA methylase IME4